MVTKKKMRRKVHSTAKTVWKKEYQLLEISYNYKSTCTCTSSLLSKDISSLSEDVIMELTDQENNATPCRPQRKIQFTMHGRKVTGNFSPSGWLNRTCGKRVSPFIIQLTQGGWELTIISPSLKSNI